MFLDLFSQLSITGLWIKPVGAALAAMSAYVAAKAAPCNQWFLESSKFDPQSIIANHLQQLFGYTNFWCLFYRILIVA